MTTLKDQLYETIHRNKKPLKLIAEEIGVSENYLTRAALPDPEETENGTGCRFPLKKLIPLIRTTGDFSVLDHIEASLGRVAIMLPSEKGSLSNIYRLSMSTIKEFGELMAELDSRMADGDLSDDDVFRVKKEAYEAIQAINSLIYGVEHIGK